MKKRIALSLCLVSLATTVHAAGPAVRPEPRDHVETLAKIHRLATEDQTREQLDFGPRRRTKLLHELGNHPGESAKRKVIENYLYALQDSVMRFEARVESLANYPEDGNPKDWELVFEALKTERWNHQNSFFEPSFVAQVGSPALRELQDRISERLAEASETLLQIETGHDEGPAGSPTIHRGRKKLKTLGSNL
jgi:hypothetical protein